VTEASLSITISPAPSIFVIDLWDNHAPDLGSLPVIHIEPRRWWLIGATSAAEVLSRQIASHGNLTPIGGGMMRAELRGVGWRDLLMVGGWFDAENTAFTVGCSAATLIHHIPVCLHVREAEVCDVYFAASYREAFERHWRGFDS
jgi:sarcosine oxidase gamma subunit